MHLWQQKYQFPSINEVLKYFLVTDHFSDGACADTSLL